MRIIKAIFAVLIAFRDALVWVWRNRKMINGYRKLVLAVVVAASITEMASAWHERRETQIECVAKSGWHEARGGDELGEKLAGFSVMNRTKDGRWGKNPCETVYKRYTRPGGRIVCDYSWTCDDRLRAKTPSGASWERSKKIAREVYKGWTPAKEFTCVLYYRVTDDKRLSKENLEYFAQKREVGIQGGHRWYCENPAILKRLARR